MIKNKSAAVPLIITAISLVLTSDDCALSGIHLQCFFCLITIETMGFIWLYAGKILNSSIGSYLFEMLIEGIADYLISAALASLLAPLLAALKTAIFGEKEKSKLEGDIEEND